MEMSGEQRESSDSESATIAWDIACHAFVSTSFGCVRTINFFLAFLNSKWFVAV